MVVAPQLVVELVEAQVEEAVTPAAAAEITQAVTPAAAAVRSSPMG